MMENEESHTFNNEIECTQCGKSFYFELSRCPNCGMRVHPDENPLEADLGWEVAPSRDYFEELSRKLTPWIAVFLGLIASFLVASFGFFGLSRAFPVFTDGQIGRVILLATTPLSAFLGGYLAAAIEKINPVRQGLGVGVSAILVAIILTAFERDLTVEPWIVGETIPWWLSIIFGGGLGGALWGRLRQDTMINALFSDFPDESELFRDLLAKVGHDTERVERMVDYEKKFMPNGTRRTLLESAIDRWNKDNR